MLEKYSRLLNQSGIEYWDARQLQTHSTNIALWNGHMKDFLSSEKKGWNLRIKYKGAMVFVHSDGEPVKETIKKAIKLAKVFATKIKKPTRMSGHKAIRAKKSSQFKIHPQDISLDEKKALLFEQLPLLKTKELKSSQLIYLDVEKKQHFENSEGSSIYQTLVHTYFGASVALQGRSLESYDLRKGMMAGFEATKYLPALVKETLTTGKLLLKAKTIKGGNMPVICDGALTDVFVHEAVGHAAEADLALQNDSCLNGQLGKKVAPDMVTLYDSPLEPTGWGSYFYDDEGTPAQKTVLINKGIFSHFLHNRETAPEMQTVSTGNGRLQDVHSYPLVRMSNTFLKPGNQSLQELIQGIKKGVYLKGSRGGEVNTAAGSFLFNAQYGYVIKNGKLGDPVKQVSLGGKTLDILKSISGITQARDRGFPGFCGKNGQSVQVEGVNPQIRIEKALVGGK